MVILLTVKIKVIYIGLFNWMGRGRGGVKYFQYDQITILIPNIRTNRPEQFTGSQDSSVGSKFCHMTSTPQLCRFESIRVAGQ